MQGDLDPGNCCSNSLLCDRLEKYLGQDGFATPASRYNFLGPQGPLSTSARPSTHAYSGKKKLEEKGKTSTNLVCLDCFSDNWEPQSMAVIVAWCSGFKDIKYDMPVCYEDHIYIEIYIYIHIYI